jgi:hypothetical protein
MKKSYGAKAVSTVNLLNPCTNVTSLKVMDEWMRDEKVQFHYVTPPV